MNRAARSHLGPWTSLLLAALVVGCGRQTLEELDPDRWQQGADRFYDAGDLPRAVVRYERAYALLDPRVPGVTQRRAGMAFAVARCLGLMVNQDRELYTPAQRREMGRDVDGWLDLALTLDPERGWVHFQRARLRDRGDEALDDADGARAAYTAFLAWAAGDPPARLDPPPADARPLVFARERLADLEAASD